MMKVEKKKRTIEDVYELMLEEEEKKKDILIDPSVIRVNPLDGGLINIESGKSYQVTEWSAMQFCKLLNGLPPKYFRESPNYLKAENANYWLNRMEEGQKKKILRLKSDGERDVLRGILSHNYSSFDNVQAVGILKELLEDRDDYKIEQFSNSDTYLNMRVTFDDLNKVDDDDHKIGFVFQNSEVGARSVRVIPYVYRLICSNGMMMWKQTGAGLKQRHYGVGATELYEEVAVALGEAMKVGKETIEKLKRAKNIPVLDVHETIEKMAKEYRYNRKMVAEIKKSYQVEPMRNAYGIVQAFTRTAKQLPIEKQNKMEMDAGEMLKKWVG